MQNISIHTSKSKEILCICIEYISSRGIAGDGRDAGTGTDR